MGIKNNAGFTIIETLLFLAITGLLIMGILAGAGSSIVVQRYRDSVDTLKTVLQTQYSETLNVRNEDRAVSLACDSNAITSETGAVLPRGQSKCVVLGRYMTIVDKTITVSTVIGANSSSTTYPTDIDELKAYKMTRLSGSAEVSELEWGAQIAWPKSGSGSRSPSTPRTIAILILRSPTSGLTYTFTGDSDVSDVSTLVLAGTATSGGQSQRRVCVQSGDVFSGGLAVFINAYAAGASAIEVRSNEMGDSSTC